MGLILLISNPWWGLSTPSPWWLAFFQEGATEMDHMWILCGLLVGENGHIFVHACVHVYDPTTPSQCHTHRSPMNRCSQIWHWCWIEEPKNSNFKTIKLWGPYIKGLWQFNGVDWFRKLGHNEIFLLLLTMIVMIPSLSKPNRLSLWERGLGGLLFLGNMSILKLWICFHAILCVCYICWLVIVIPVRTFNSVDNWLPIVWME